MTTMEFGPTSPLSRSTKKHVHPPAGSFDFFDSVNGNKTPRPRAGQRCLPTLTSFEFHRAIYMVAIWEK